MKNIPVKIFTVLLLFGFAGCALWGKQYEQQNITLEILDAQTGQPVSGVRVKALTESTDLEKAKTRVGTKDPFRNVATQAVTDEKGVLFISPVIPKERYAIRWIFRHPYYGTQQFSGDPGRPGNPPAGSITVDETPALPRYRLHLTK